MKRTCRSRMAAICAQTLKYHGCPSDMPFETGAFDNMGRTTIYSVDNGNRKIAVDYSNPLPVPRNTTDAIQQI